MFSSEILFSREFKMNRSSTPVIIASMTILLFSSCGYCGSRPDDVSVKGSSLEKITLSKHDTSFDETARFLAGVAQGNSPRYRKLISLPWYQKYRRNIEKSWQGFFRPNMEKIRTWRKNNLTSPYSKSVFYPFSGPDILNPLLFYPEARDILMFGLEPTGGIPVMKSMTPWRLKRQTQKLLAAINFSLKHAFFVTTDMQKKVKKSSLNGITAVMFFFLAREGYTIHNAREIHITSRGLVAAGKAKKKNDIPGIEIIFSPGSRKDLRRARYFSLDISNKSRRFRPFSRYVRNNGSLTTIIKSASYLMTWKTFSKIRNLIMERSESVLQDDSGIPYRYFKNNKKWDLTYFGMYHRPLPVFKKRYQKSLRDDVKKYSRGPVPFVYGYGYGYPDMTYHLLLARKKTADRKD